MCPNRTAVRYAHNIYLHQVYNTSNVPGMYTEVKPIPCEIEDFGEIHLYKLRGILRSRNLHLYRCTTHAQQNTKIKTVRTEQRRMGAWVGRWAVLETQKSASSFLHLDPAEPSLSSSPSCAAVAAAAAAVPAAAAARFVP